MMMDRGVKSSLEQSLTMIISFLRSVLSLPSNFKDKSLVQAWNSQIMVVYLLCFKFILGLKFFDHELVSISFAVVPDYGNEYTTKENKN